jgi:6-phosphogluconate dehydrogenase
MSQADFGLIGLAVMGQNLVLNVESRGFTVAVFNRTTSVTDEFLAKHPGKKLVGSHTLEEFVKSLKRPRKIQIMVKSNAVTDTDRDAVDAVIEQLIPLLEEDDIIIDGGNSFYKATERRDAYLAEKKLRFIGAGVSGGEEGARKGPSIMPGGPASTWEVMKPIFESIAAKVDGEPCVIHIGPGGAGHYVKMIHNGIEYGDMQLICEAYNIFKHAGFTTDEMAAIFNDWNEGDLLSYLIQITGKALEQKDAEWNSSWTRPARRAPASGRCSTRRKMPSSFPPSTPRWRRASFLVRKSSAWPPARNSKAPCPTSTSPKRTS